MGGPLVALRNDDGAGNWLIVKLDVASPHTDAIGATVTIDVDGDSIMVRWPSGTATSLTDVPANQRIAYRSSSAHDLNLSPSRRH